MVLFSALSHTNTTFDNQALNLTGNRLAQVSIQVKLVREGSLCTESGVLDVVVWRLGVFATPLGALLVPLWLKVKFTLWFPCQVHLYAAPCPLFPLCVCMGLGRGVGKVLYTWEVGRFYLYSFVPSCV